MGGKWGGMIGRELEVERGAHPLLAAELWQRGTEEQVAAEGPRRVKEGLFYYVFYDRKGNEKSIWWWGAHAARLVGS